MRCRCRLLALLVFLLGFGAPAPASAQLRYASTTRTEFGGTMGRLIGMVPGGADPSLQTTSIQGTKIRNDSERSSTIMDWASGTMTMLDHESRTFTRFDFAQMAEGMAASFQTGMAEARAEAPPTEPASAPQVQAEVSVDRTGRSETIAGYQADQVILTLTLAPTDEATAQNPEMAGAEMDVVTELWLSTEFPEAQLMEAMQGEAMDRMRETFSAQGGPATSMQAVSAFDPRMEGAWARTAEELSKLKGTALRTTMHFVTVPPGVELDRDKVLASSDESLAAGAGGAAAATAADAAKKALGGLAGRFGRGRKPEPREEAPPEMAQAVFMRVVTEITDVESGDLDEAIFLVPAGYTERQVPGGGSFRP